MGGLKNNWFFETEVDLLFGWATWLVGVREPKKGIYDEPPTLGIPRQHVILMMAFVGRLAFRGAVPL